MLVGSEMSMKHSFKDLIFLVHEIFQIGYPHEIGIEPVGAEKIRIIEILQMDQVT